MPVHSGSSPKPGLVPSSRFLGCWVRRAARAGTWEHGHGTGRPRCLRSWPGWSRLGTAHSPFLPHALQHGVSQTLCQQSALVKISNQSQPQSGQPRKLLQVVMVSVPKSPPVYLALHAPGRPALRLRFDLSCCLFLL